MTQARRLHSAQPRNHFTNCWRHEQVDDSTSGTAVASLWMSSCRRAGRRLYLGQLLAPSRSDHFFYAIFVDTPHQPIGRVAVNMGNLRRRNQQLQLQVFA